MHCHVAPYNEYHEPPCIIDNMGYEATGSRYAAWAQGRTLQGYRGAAGLGPPALDDIEAVRYWNASENTYDPAQPVGDGSHWIVDDLFQWNGEGQPFDWCPPGDGSLTYFVMWVDDYYLVPGGECMPDTNDGQAYDDADIAVVNNTYACIGQIYAEDLAGYLSYLVPQQLVWPPEPDHIFDGGQVHFAVGSDFWLNDIAYVESYEVDPATGQCGVCPLDEGYKTHAYHYGVTDEPEFRQGHAFRPTNQPACWYHYQDHSGIPNMLTPPQNPTLTGTVCVVKGSVDVGDPIPHQDGDPAVAISYGVAPAETILAPEPDAIVVEVYYPGYENFKKRWEFSGGQGLSGSFYWDGLLDLYDDYGNLFASNVGYCPCSTVFARISVKVKDHYWTIYAIQEPIREWTWEMPRISIIQPQWDSLFMVTDPAEMVLMASPSVTAPVSDAQWSGGEDPPTGNGSSFTTAFRLNLGGQLISATLNDVVLGTTFLTQQALVSWGIEELQWMQWVDEGGILESGSDGLVIFPEYTVEDVQQGRTPSRRRVLLRAKLNIQEKDIPVRFRLIDVDDPSTATGPIDEKDSNSLDEDGDGLDIDGDDNKGSFSWFGLGIGYDYSLNEGVACVKTNPYGYAGVLIDVSTKPGDNYRGVASLGIVILQSVKSGLYGGKADGAPTVHYVYQGKRVFFPDWPDKHTVATPQNLTVWRKLHCECDTMQDVLPANNNVNGTVTNIVQGTPTRVYIQAGQEPTPPGPAGRFENGLLVYGGGWVPLGWSAYDGSGFYVSAAGSLGNLQIGNVVTLYDDDYQFTGGNAQSRGSLPVLPNVAGAASYFTPAFIRIVADGAGGTDGDQYQARAYTADSPIPPPDYNSKRQSIGKASSNFWVAYVITNFQHGELTANDGGFLPFGGIANYPAEQRGAWIFRETLRDANYNEGRAIAHEIGHLFAFQDNEVGGTVVQFEGHEGPLAVVLIDKKLAEGSNILGGFFCSEECDGYIISYEYDNDRTRLWVDSPNDTEAGKSYTYTGNDIMGIGVGGFSPLQIDTLRNNTVSPVP
jgi:hypothetical protein